MSRPQWNTAKCGNCGKKKAYETRCALSFGTIIEVRCMACNSEARFCGSMNDVGVPVYPGKEAAALFLSPTPEPEGDTQ